MSGKRERCPLCNIEFYDLRHHLIQRTYSYSEFTIAKHLEDNVAKHHGIMRKRYLRIIR